MKICNILEWLIIDHLNSLPLPFPLKILYDGIKSILCIVHTNNAKAYE